MVIEAGIVVLTNGRRGRVPPPVPQRLIAGENL